MHVCRDFSQSSVFRGLQLWNASEAQRKKKGTYRLHMSISGPYVFPTTNSSGAAYSGDPQWVCSGLSRVQTLLRPKSAKIWENNAWYRIQYFELFYFAEWCVCVSLPERLEMCLCEAAGVKDQRRGPDTARFSTDELRVTSNLRGDSPSAGQLDICHLNYGSRWIICELFGS